MNRSAAAKDNFNVAEFPGMKTAEPNRVVRFLPSLTDAAFLVPLPWLPVHTPFIGAFKESQRWRPAYADGMAIVFPSAAALASATAGEDVTASASAGVAPADGNQRGREITKPNQRDRRITQPNTRSE